MVPTPNRSDEYSAIRETQLSSMVPNPPLETPFAHDREGVIMSSVTDEQVLARFTSLGVSLDHVFMVPSVDAEDEGLIAFWHPEVGVRFLILENDTLAEACYAFLRRRGARRFASGDDILQTAGVEKWPGWDSCDDAVRARQ